MHGQQIDHVRAEAALALELAEALATIVERTAVGLTPGRTFGPTFGQGTDPAAARDHPAPPAGVGESAFCASPESRSNHAHSAENLPG